MSEKLFALSGLSKHPPVKMITEKDSPESLRMEAACLLKDADDLKHPWVLKCQEAYEKCSESIALSMQNFKAMDPKVEELRSMILRELKNAGESV